MKKTFSTNNATRRDSYYHRQPPSPIFHHRNPGFHSNHRHLPTHPRLPTFTINLRFNHRTHHRDLRRNDLESLIKKCKPNPNNFTFNTNDSIAASLNFNQKTDAINAVVWFWQSRLSVNPTRIHNFTPEFITNSDNVEHELDIRLRNVFVSHVKELMNGNEVNRWIKEWDRLLKEINHVNSLLSKSFPIRVQEQNIETKKVLDGEKSLIERRLREFESAMECILKYLEEKNNDENCDYDYDYEVVNVFRFGENFDWEKIYNLIVRECCRLEEGLPIYAYRKEILQQIHNQQITVLIGETGSGKSTQIVQFLADSGIGAKESIVCTQPRKIAAKSLAERVQEECGGCYEGNSIKCYSTFSSWNKFDSRITFMTDHCLLQHYMSDKNLSGISCIIVDEAHERSINTDLLLALIKNLFCKRVEMRLIIMSATADAKQLSDYFYGCGIFRVLGRNFPVEVRYVPSDRGGRSGSAVVDSYVSDVVKMATEIHVTENEGTILAFLTSQLDVEWACEKFEAHSAVALPLHGKLSSEEQFHVFRNYPGKRKVIFSTNVAETSLTIPGVKYVIDSGLVKDSRFDPCSGMNVLKVCWISQSSANQRAGRAGRTEPGRCYRLYSEADYQSMELNQDPEIRRVHLGVAVLKVLALGAKNVQDFDFVDAPSPSSIERAIRNLIQLGAIKLNNNVHELTSEGRRLARMEIEPRLGKLILGCLQYALGREGIALAVMMANARSVFCRVGNEGDKQRSDCLKVQFCHCDGDLFTLLSVYKEWEALPQDMKNKWCWENSINAKSMRRCQNTFLELESCLENELGFVVPSYWRWDPHIPSIHDKNMKMAILSSLSENVAMYSGRNQLGYEVAQTGQLVQLHPSCSLLIFAQRPSWVVFYELRSESNEYLFCVSVIDFQSLYSLKTPPLFDISKMEERKLQMRTLSGFGKHVLKRFCGKGNLLGHVSRIRKACMDERIFVEVNFDENQVQLYASSHDLNTASKLVNDVLEYEKKRLYNECMEKCLYHGSGSLSPVALFGSGAEIKHLELEKHSLSVDVFHPNVNTIDEMDLLMFFEKNTSGCICDMHKSTSMVKDVEDKEKWGRITFLTPNAAKRAAELDGEEFRNLPLKIVPSQSAMGGDKTFSFPAVEARISWPRRPTRAIGMVICDKNDVNFILRDFQNLIIDDIYIRCAPNDKYMDRIMISGLDKELPETEILDVLRSATSRRILDFFFLRGDAVVNPPCSVIEEALLKEILPLMPKRNPHISSCRVQVFPPKPKDYLMSALIHFDGRLHLEAAKALENIDGKVLPGCLSWQKIKSQQLFHSTLIFSSPVYHVIKEELEKVLARLKSLEGLEWNLDRTPNGSHRVKITANATKTVAEGRRPLEELWRGKTTVHDNLTPSVLQLMLSKDGYSLTSSIQQATTTYIQFDRRNLNIRIFGSPDKIALAEQKLIQSLLSLHEEKQLVIHLRGRDLPSDLMKRVVKNFGPDLHGLKEKVPGADLKLNTRDQTILLHGNTEIKSRVEEITFDIARLSNQSIERLDTGPSCQICLCEVEDGYQLEGCGHLFCRSCMVEQCESAIKNQGSFPIRCAHQGCGHHILLADFRTLLSNDKLEELFRASLGAFVASSSGTYRFCPSPDCPSIYRVADPDTASVPFVCGACYSETCTRCHLEYHPYVSCERYRELKHDPDSSSLRDWCKGKEHVKWCSACGHVIEKVDGCNHIECKCGKHICWVCLEFFNSSVECYEHMVIHDDNFPVALNLFSTDRKSDRELLQVFLEKIEEMKEKYRQVLTMKEVVGKVLPALYGKLIGTSF